MVEGLSAAGYRAWVDSTNAADTTGTVDEASGADAEAGADADDQATVPDVRAVRLRYRRESDFSRAATMISTRASAMSDRSDVILRLPSSP